MRSSLLSPKSSSPISLLSKSSRLFSHNSGPPARSNTLRKCAVAGIFRHASRPTPRPVNVPINLRRSFTQEIPPKEGDAHRKRSDLLTLPVAFPGSPGGQGGSGGGGLFSITRSPLFDAALTTFIGLGMGELTFYYDCMTELS